jgi:hypothetical protein
VANPTPDEQRLKRIADGLDREMKATPERDGRLARVSRRLRIMRLCPLKQVQMAAHHLLSFSWGSSPAQPRGIYPGLSELFLRTNLDENSRLVQLSDGGHFENLGLYELIRRRLQLIIVCDGTADPRFTFEDLANAMEKVRADFGTLIELDAKELEGMIPGREHGVAPRQKEAVAFAEKGYLTATIRYNDGSSGSLLYLNTTLFKTVTADLYGYRKAHGSFPDQPTSNQFFDESQFEAYRELGYQTAFEMMRNKELIGRQDVKDTLGTPIGVHAKEHATR